MSYSRLNSAFNSSHPSFETRTQSHSDLGEDGNKKRDREEPAVRAEIPDDVRFIFLSKRNATVDALVPNREAFPATIAEANLALQAQDNYVTPLWQATLHGRVDEVRELLEQGADMHEACYDQGEYIDSPYELVRNQFKEIPNRDEMWEEFRKYILQP